MKTENTQPFSRSARNLEYGLWMYKQQCQRTEGMHYASFRNRSLKSGLVPKIFLNLLKLTSVSIVYRILWILFFCGGVNVTKGEKLEWFNCLLPLQ